MISVYLSTMKLTATVKDINGVAVDNADSVELTIADSAGAPITASGVSWPVTLTAVGSGGRYTWVYPEGVRVALLNGLTYLGQILATVGTSKRYAAPQITVQTDQD